MDELEKKFNKAIIDGCEEARKLGYRPSQFLQMIGDYGALGAAKRIISKPTVTEGFTKLWELKRLDLSVEAIVLRPEYKSLFSEEERVMCKKNLLSFGYEISQDKEIDIDNIPVEDIEDTLLEKVAKQRGVEKPKMREVTISQRDRDPYIAEYAKRRAKGICQLCGKPAPFVNEKGIPYLESHHIVWLSEGGEDSVENTVALCPNCHRKMHVVKDKKDIEILQKKVLLSSESRDEF